MKKVFCVVLIVMMTLSLLTVFAEEQTETPAEETTTISVENNAILERCYTLAYNAISAQDYNNAKDYIGVCLGYCDPQTDPTMYADLLLKLACINVIEEKYDIAQLNLNSVLRIQPDWADAYLVRVQAYAAQDNVDKAIENLEKYIELSQETGLYQTLAELYEAKGSMAAAQEAYDKYVAALAEPTEEEIFQAALYRKQADDFEGSITTFETLADSEVYGAGAMFNIAVSKMNLGDYAGATKAFNDCEEKGGTFEGLYFYRGLSKAMIDAWAEAAADFAQSIEKEQLVNEATYYLAYSQFMQDDYEAAIANFTAYIENVNNDYSAYSFRAACEVAAGLQEEALADYTVCIENGYDLFNSYSQRAAVYQTMGDTENYNKDLRESLKYAE